MIHIPALRWGEPYKSMEVDQVVHFATGEVLAEVSRANGGLVERDMRQAKRAREVLRVEEGSLYPALYRMEEAGWIRAEWIKKASGRRARVYELTASGKKQLGAEESRWQAVSLAINRVLREA